MTLPLRRLNLWATCSPVFFSDGAVHPFDDHEREDNVEPAGRDTFQAKTVRNREAVPPGTPNLPGNGTVKEKHRVLHSVIDKVFNWNNLKSASRKVVRNKGSAGVDGMSVKQWQEKEEEHLQELRWRLIRDTYRSKPALRVISPNRGAPSGVRSAFPQ